MGGVDARAAAAVDAALSEESDEVVERIRSPTDDCSAADAAAAEAASEGHRRGDRRAVDGT